MKKEGKLSLLFYWLRPVGLAFAPLIFFVLLLMVVQPSLSVQSVYSTISGTVEDASKALIPGVTITATNIGTGVVTTTISNEAGAYNFASLAPGRYQVTGEL